KADEEVRCALDSLLEGDGFEIPVPRQKKAAVLRLRSGWGRLIAGAADSSERSRGPWQTRRPVSAAQGGRHCRNEARPLCWSWRGTQKRTVPALAERDSSGKAGRDGRPYRRAQRGSGKTRRSRPDDE